MFANWNPPIPIVRLLVRNRIDMKRISLILICLLLWCPVLFAGPEIFFMSQQKPELLLNGGFESGAGTPTSWTTYGTPTCVQTADPRTGSTGSYCTAIAIGTGNNVLYQAVTTISGKGYAFTGWLKNVDATYAKVILYDSAWTQIDVTANYSATSWGQQTLTWTAADTTYYIYLNIQGATGNITKFDDFSVKRTS